MTYTVEVRYIGGDLAELLHDMRIWLDRNRIKPEQFRHSFSPPGLAFRIELSDRDQATAFAEAFGGWVEGTDPQGASAHWVMPPSTRKTHGREDTVSRSSGCRSTTT